MTSLLSKTTTILDKMRTFRFCAIALLVLLPALTNAASVSFGVTFGTPQPNGGACVGKGVCKESYTGDFASSDAVNVTFLVTPSNPEVLVMRFNMSDLMRKQPDKVASFNDPSGYSFDAIYSLTGPQFASLSLLPNARVMPNMKYTVQVTEDVVSVYIPYAHDPAN